MPEARASPSDPSGAYRQRCRVPAYDVGANHRLTVPGLLRQLHEVAQAHAASLGYGYAQLQPRGLAWALVTLELELRALPGGGADYTVATAVGATRGPLAYRDYVATDQGGRVFAGGQSMWALIDTGSRSTAPPPPDLLDVLTRMHTRIQESVDGVRRFAAPPSAELVVADQRRVHYHDCDFNGHLNNVVAARWLLDTVYAADPVLRSIRAGDQDAVRLRLSYFQELLLGERVLCRTGKLPDGTRVATLLRARDERVCVVASLGERLAVGD